MYAQTIEHVEHIGIVMTNSLQQFFYYTWKISQNVGVSLSLSEKNLYYKKNTRSISDDLVEVEWVVLEQFFYTFGQFFGVCLLSAKYLGRSIKSLVPSLLCF